MSLITELRCVACGASYAQGDSLTCSKCGPDEGILDVRYDLERAARTLTRAALATRTRSHWRYRELLPLDDAFCPSDGTIGWTPIIEAPRLAKELGVARLRLKDEGRSASGSFKDRASSVGVARARQEGRTSIACASTGNAASSLAHCCAAAGLECNIFVSQVVPQGKLAQLLAYGARVFKVMDTYASAYDLCTRACERFGWYNRNAAINPYLVEGKKTGGLEVAEQCADDPPGWVAISVGDGCSIAGVHKGIVQMKRLGLIEWDTRMLGVQAAGIAPIAKLFEAESDSASPCRASSWHGRVGRAPAPWHGRVGRVSAPWHGRVGRVSAGEKDSRICDENVAQPPPAVVSSGDTYADSINVPVPRNRRKALNAVRDSHGAFVTVSDEQIMEAVRLTGRLSGVFAEPAAAAAVAGIVQARRQRIIAAEADVVAMITGNGMKDVAGAIRAVGAPHEIKAELDEVVQIVERDAT